VAPSALPTIPLDTSQFKPGLRVAVGLSGGADSVALTRALAERSRELGIVVRAAHLHHGLRGGEADRDQQFASDLARSLGIQFHSHQVDTAAEAASAKETIEEAARRLRYAWFRQLMAAREVDAVATAHTLDDQAETVLGKLIRGAWTEGISGIHPVVQFPEGQILRPMLATTRSQVEAYLSGLGQTWVEDASNADLAFTRNRIRHELLPQLNQWNPRIREHFSQMAELARDEELFWQAEVSRIAPQLVLPGRPVRGGGRAGSEETAISLDVVRLAAQSPAIQRRLLRHVADSLSVSLGFEATEALRNLALTGRSGQQLALPGPLTAERSPRELRITPQSPKTSRSSDQFQLPVPGENTAFGWRFCAHSAESSAPAIIRNWRPGDRVTLRHSSGPRKIKEILERMKVSGTQRAEWPVVEWQGQIIWMKGADLAAVPGIVVSAEEE